MTGSQEARDRHRQTLALERIVNLLENLCEKFAASNKNALEVQTVNYIPVEGYAAGAPKVGE